MNEEERTDHVHLLPPIHIGGSDIVLEVTFLGSAWIDGSYATRKEKPNEITLAISRLKNILIEHGRG